MQSLSQVEKHLKWLEQIITDIREMESKGSGWKKFNGTHDTTWYKRAAVSNHDKERRNK